MVREHGEYDCLDFCYQALSEDPKYQKSRRSFDEAYPDYVQQTYCLSAVATSPLAQGRGLATALIQHMAPTAREAGRRMTLATQSEANVRGRVQPEASADYSS